ncbi:hypothetical protein MPSEU_000092300 [Mayamaea pseudoterrestris]|nr:hypothetical protein MPSEU_000092300 [Mayamaea pseudoterrestris]
MLHHATTASSQEHHNESWSTLMSDDEDAFEFDDHDDDVCGASPLYHHESKMIPSPLQRWKRLQKHFATRDMALQRIARGKSKTMVDLLHRQEHQVREQQREELLMKVLFHKEKRSSNDQVSNENDKKSLSSHHDELDQIDSLIMELSKPLVLPSECSNIHKTGWSWLQTIHDLLIFEAYTTVPAVASLLVHTLAHASIYELIQCAIHVARKYFLASAATAPVEAYIAIGLLVCGVTLVRLSGYLYWWCNSIDFKCVKFSYHNRNLLNMVDAKSMRWVKRKESVRAVCYILGYDLLYCAVLYLQSRIFWYCFDQRDKLMVDMPSQKYDQHVSLNAMLTEFENSKYPFACQLELELLEQRRNDLREADVAYTWNAFSGFSFETYWSEFGQGLAEDVGETIISPGREIMCNCLLFAACVGILHLYGFEFFHKY